ncbi:MAG: hypothetical protein ACI3ZQ_02545 [Candidatus Cryptobacteroides sp.]
MRRKFTLTIVYTLSILTGCSRQARDIDKINTLLNRENTIDGVYSDEQFEKVFKLIEDNPKTLDYDFSEADNIEVTTSDDGNIRAYILERYGFGGNPSLGFETATLIQYRICGQIHTARFPETNCIITDMTHLSGDKYLFITFRGSVAQGEHNHNNARVYTIDAGGLTQNTKVFKTDGRLEDEVEVYWETFIEDLDYNAAETVSGKGILFNQADKTLYVSEPEIDSDSFVTLTERYRRFGWKNGVFKDVTLMEPFEVKNDKYYIRIEQNRDGSCIYRCWNGGVKQGKPDLTIRNGLRQFCTEESLVDYDKWISLDESTPLGEKYTFKNKGYEYVYLSGWSKGRTYEDLKVYSPAGEMIYSGSFIPVSQAISVPQI